MFSKKKEEPKKASKVEEKPAPTPVPAPSVDAPAVLPEKVACASCGKKVDVYEILDLATRKGYCSANCYIKK